MRRPARRSEPVDMVNPSAVRADAPLGADVRHPAPPHRRPPTGSSFEPPGPGDRRTGTGPARTGRLTAWCIRRRWTVLTAALLVVVAAVAMLSTGIVTTPPGDQLVGDSARAQRILAAADFGDNGRPTEHIIVTARGDRLEAAAVPALSADLTAAYAGLDGVAGVGRPVPGQDGRSLVLPVQLRAAAVGSPAARDGTLPTPDTVVGPVQRATDAFAAAHPQYDVGQVGPGSVRAQMNQTFLADFRRAEVFSIPLTLLILLIAFGAVVAAGVPLILGLGSVAVALGLTALTSQHVVTVDPNAQSLILVIGLAVGVDYALFVLRRAREERAAGASVGESIRRAGSTAGRAVVISGLTVMVAMSGMLVAGGLFASMAIGTLLVVGVAVLGAATVLPAIMSVLGDNVERLRIPGRRRAGDRTDRSVLDSRWGRLAGRVCAHPLRWGLVAALALGALAVPAGGMTTGLGGVETLPAQMKVVQAHRQLQAAVPTDGTVVSLVVQAPESARAQVARALVEAGRAADGMEHVTGVEAAPHHSVDGTVSVRRLGVDLDQSDAALHDVVERVRADVVPRVERDLSDVPNVMVHVGGDAASTDLAAWMDGRLPWVVGFVLALTFLVMLVSFGSPWLAVTTVGLNALSVGAAYGVMTAVFQGTWAQSLLDFTSTGSIASWLPLLMFVVLFGLSMDYHVFVLSRVREGYDAGLDPKTAVRSGVARSAGVVSSAAAVMVAVFAVFGTLSMVEMKQLGVGLAVAVFLDATVVRGVLLPAVLTLLGRRAHTGPAWIPRVHH